MAMLPNCGSIADSSRFGTPGCDDRPTLLFHLSRAVSPPRRTVPHTPRCLRARFRRARTPLYRLGLLFHLSWKDAARGAGGLEAKQSAMLPQFGSIAIVRRKTARAPRPTQPPYYLPNELLNRTSLLRLRHTIRHPLRRRRALQVVIEELLHPLLEILLVLLSAQMVRLAGI